MEIFDLGSGTFILQFLHIMSIITFALRYILCDDIRVIAAIWDNCFRLDNMSVVFNYDICCL